jgi:UDP:flavonoid glycosyltransferase YjiC (YdhE family)
MRILATCSLGGSGHWLPLAGFLRAAVQPDDEVVVIAPPALRAMVEHDGFRFEAGAEPPEAVIAPIRERLPTEHPDVAAVLGNRVLFAELAATAMLPHVDAFCADWNPDVVVRDPCEYAGAIVAANRSIRSAQVGISQATVEWSSLDIASRALEQHRPGLTGDIAAAPYLSRFPALMDPSAFPATHRYRIRPSSATEPLPDWWGEHSTVPSTHQRKPLVYLTFGTVLPYLSFAADAYRFALAALSSVDARVLLTVGRSFPVDQLDPLPPNAHVEPWIEQDRAVRNAAVVVCHGGSGTLLGAIEAATPLVVMPFFSDQRSNGRLVDRHRLGTVVVPTASPHDRRPTFGQADARRLAHAVEELLAHPDRADGFSTVTSSWAETPTPAEILADM